MEDAARVDESASGRLHSAARAFACTARMDHALFRHYHREQAAQAVAAEVVAELSDGTMLAAVITGGSVRRLGLSVGAPVWASFGAFSVILNFG